MRYLYSTFLIFFINCVFGDPPTRVHISIADPSPLPEEQLERLITTDPEKATIHMNPYKASGSGNDICSEAITLTVGNSFTCGNTATNSAASAFPNACITTSGSGIQQFRTDWYCFNSGNNKTLALVINSITNTTSFNAGLAVFGPYSSCASGCAASMSGPLCDNVISAPVIDSIKILENLTQNAYYLIAIIERRSNPNISAGASYSYCISVQPTDLDDCEITPSGCPATCGILCVYGQATVPDAADVVANCNEQAFSHRIQGSSTASPADTIEFCYDFQVNSGCTVSFSTVVSVSGCVGPGNISAPNWSIYDASSCSVLSSGNSIPISTTVSTAGNYIFCFKYTAACAFHFGTWIYGYGTCVIVNPVLPVELTAFEVTELERENRLTWTTLSEFNNHYFDIERSLDGIKFEKIGRVYAHNPDGNSQAKLDYQFSDTQPFPGTSYYRLNQTDRDGQFSYSPIVMAYREAESFRILGIQNHHDNGNPVINFEDYGENKIKISVSDFAGRLVYENNIRSLNGLNTFVLPVRSLDKGIYIIRLSKSDDSFIATKFGKI